MGQKLLPDNVPLLVKASSTTCTLAATNQGQATRITIAGQQYKIASILTLNTATTGLGGLDTGSLTNTHSLYYVYACANSSGVVGLVASLSGPSVGPAGFTTRCTLVGAFYSMNSGNQIGSTVNLLTCETDWIPWTSSIVAATPPTPGAGASMQAFWKRRGSTIDIRWQYLQTGSGTAGSGGYYVPLPTSLVPDPSYLSFSSQPRAPVGTATMSNGTGAIYSGTVFITTSFGDVNGAMAIVIEDPAVATPGVWDQASFVNLSVAAPRIRFTVFNLPITGWTPSIFG